MSEKAARTVFIGNIPYGQSEEQIKEICSTVGQVITFRPIFDNDTGRPRGYGFVEYADADAAASAVRNLNGYKIEGRELRVDFSKRSDAENTNDAVQNAPLPVSTSGASAGASSNGIGALPPGQELPPGVTCADAISKTLSTLPAPQLLDILSQMKGLVTGDPSKATVLLQQAPQLSYAIFQALLLMGLVDSQLVATVLQSAAASSAAAEPAPLPPPQPQAPPQQQFSGYTQTPPVVQNPYPAPAPAPQYQTPQNAGPDPQELLKQVLAMPQSEVDKLGPAERSQIMALKQQYAGYSF